MQRQDGTLTSADIQFERSVNPFSDPEPNVLTLASVNSALSSGIQRPLDVAILKQQPPRADVWRKVDEIPFDFERRRVSIIGESHSERVLVTKGAPEGVLAVCDRAEIGGAVLDLDGETRARCEATFQALSAEGFRVLALKRRGHAMRYIGDGIIDTPSLHAADVSVSVVGPISSLYDFTTFFVLLNVLNAGEQEFHTGWFVESLTTQTLVLFVIRTAGNPFRSRPSWHLVVSVLLVVTTGIASPLSPFGDALGFTTLPIVYYAFLAVATVSYLITVETVKRRILRWD